jgi:hypothetical protein
MAVGAGARDRQRGPDPRLLEQFCRVVVPGVLTDVCHIEEELAAPVGRDILARAESYPLAAGYVVTGVDYSQRKVRFCFNNTAAKARGEHRPA